MNLVSEELERISKELGLNYKFASIKESAEALTSELEVPYFTDRVYPALIASILIDEEQDNDPRHKFKYKLKGWIVVNTDENYTTNERLTLVYKKELYPLLEKLKKKIKKSYKIVSYYGLKCKSRNIYFNKEQKTHLNENVDAIEFEIDDLIRPYDRQTTRND